MKYIKDVTGLQNLLITYYLSFIDYLLYAGHWHFIYILSIHLPYNMWDREMDTREVV